MAAPLTSAAVGVGRARILLVDDQPARLLTYETILAPLGEELVAVGSGEEALRKLMDGEFAVILLDVSMPGLDGFETAGLIHAHPRFENTPIIFVTGVHVGELDRLEGYRLGAIDYVQIPLVPDILRSKVAVLVELYHRRRELRILNESLAGENEGLARANLHLQTARAREYQQLSETLAESNAKLSAANRALENEIEERRRAELVSLELAANLRKVDRRKDEFLATLAHELRNPLAPIRSAVTVLRRDTLAERERSVTLDVVDRQVGQLVRLVDDLLDISRITHDRIELRRQRCEVASIISAACDMIRPAIDERAQRLDVIDASAGACVDGDPQRLTQVLGNLLNNASKYTPAGGSIRLEARVESDNVAIEVADDGIGIAPDALGAIFEPFVQVDEAREHSQGGLGIGLTLVKRLVDLHGGSVSAESEGPGRGARFSLLFRCDRPGDDSPPRAAATSTFARKRIGVIDDNRDAAEMLVLMLASLGHEARCVCDPAEALDMLGTFEPDIVFVDLGMPGISGFDLAPMIRARHGDRIRLIALTGWGQPSDRARTQEAGFDAHFVKPIELADVERLCSLEPYPVPAVDARP